MAKSYCENYDIPYTLVRLLTTYSCPIIYICFCVIEKLCNYTQQPVNMISYKTHSTFLSKSTETDADCKYSA